MKSNIHQNDAIADFAQDILNKRQEHFSISSLKQAAIDFLKETIDFLFPHFSDEVYYSTEDVTAKLQLLHRNLSSLIKLLNENMPGETDKTARQFVERLPEAYNRLWADAEAIYEGDPAAESLDEVILAYPGFMAILIYRIAHELYELKVPIIPRILSEYAHGITGVDIHPGAEIASPFFIDHGTGIVIGETTTIGKNVKLYQGVTLGALSVDKSLAQTKRHPTIDDNVTIYAQAVILGGETVVGRNSIIGGNSWVTKSIPPNSVVINRSEVRVRTNEQREDLIDFVI